MSKFPRKRPPPINKEATPEEVKEYLQGSPYIERPSGWQCWPNVLEGFKALSEEYIQNGITPYVGHTQDRGIVICTGGKRLFTNAWVNVNILRYLGCELPIEFWYLGPQEMDSKMKALVKPLGVTCVDAMRLREQYPARILNGYEVKAYALKHSPFRQTLLLDSDNVAVKEPTFLFNSPEFLAYRAIFWPDFSRLESFRLAWDCTGVPFQDEPEFESGQVYVDREKVWDALSLSMWYNEHSDFLYKHVHGDKETFHLAFRKLGVKYAMPPYGIHALDGVMCQHDFQGKRLFQHRNMAKWSYEGPNRVIKDFQLEERCLGYLEQLRAEWDGEIADDEPEEDEAPELYPELAGIYLYRRIGFDERLMQLKEDGEIGTGSASMERKWRIYRKPKGVEVHIVGDAGVLCKLLREDNGELHGEWEHFERMPIEMRKL
jgi:hypothetical protein